MLHLIATSTRRLCYTVILFNMWTQTLGGVTVLHSNLLKLPKLTENGDMMVSHNTFSAVWMMNVFSEFGSFCNSLKMTTWHVWGGPGQVTLSFLGVWKFQQLWVENYDSPYCDIKLPKKKIWKNMLDWMGLLGRFLGRCKVRATGAEGYPEHWQNELSSGKQKRSPSLRAGPKVSIHYWWADVWDWKPSFEQNSLLDRNCAVLFQSIDLVVS